MSTTQTTSTTTIDEEAPTSTLRLLADYAIRSTGQETAPSSSENTETLSRISVSTSPAPFASPAALNPEPAEGHIDPTTEPHPRVQGVETPGWWPEDWRRLPDYAPINYDLDRSARPNGANRIEVAFITTAIGGAGLLAFYANLWRNTLGRIVDIRYERGGEF